MQRKYFNLRGSVIARHLYCLHSVVRRFDHRPLDSFVRRPFANPSFVIALDFYCLGLLNFVMHLLDPVFHQHFHPDCLHPHFVAVVVAAAAAVAAVAVVERFYFYSL